MKSRIAPIFMLLSVICSCESDSLNSQSKVSETDLNEGEIFFNPEFECVTSDVVEPGEGYPHPFQDFPFSTQGERSIAQLEGFCARMEERFADSGLTVTEADRVYEAIPSVLHISDESYGMPSPDDPPIPPVDLAARVKLRKIAKDRYELFYFQIGCGRHYLLYELDLTAPEATVRKIERWSEIFPC